VSQSRTKIDRDAVAKELLPGASPALLQDLHLLTRGGDLNADARRKLKQINHLVGLLRPGLDDLLARFGEPVVVDCGAGKSYLGFLLAQLVFAPAGRGSIVAIEERAELVAASEERAARLGLPQLRPLHARVLEAALPERVHMVTALHACDTATDDALLLAIRKGADHVAVVPCCQAELAEQWRQQKPADEAMAALVTHPLHRREFGAHLSNVLRALVLEAHGYSVTVTELVGFEHSLKNEIILGKRVRRYSEPAQKKLAELLHKTGARPKLVRMLEAEAAAQPREVTE
jgi:Methyltransferase domain